MADRLPRGRLRAGPHGPDDRQRHRRLDHPPVRRRRAAEPRDVQGAPLRARARHEDRHPAARGRVRDRARAAAARVLDAARVVRAPPPRRHVLRGVGARRAGPDRDLLRARDLRSGRDVRRPAARQGLRREGARAGERAGRRRARRAGPRHPQQRARDGGRDGARDRGRPQRRGERGGRRRPRRRPGRPRARRAAQPVQVRRLPLGGRRLRPRGARRPHARPGGARRLRDGRARAHAARDGVLGAQRRRDRGRARAPAVRALQPVPAHAGHGPRRGPGRGGQGRDRTRLRGPLLLGHRDLRRPVPHAHQPALGAPGARLPGQDARRRA